MVGLGIVDMLIRDIVDPDTGEVYPALSCCNNDDWAARAPVGAQKVIWAINGSSRFNSDCAVLLREGFKSGKIRLLLSEDDGADNLSEIKGYNGLDERMKLKFQMPYLETTLLINELINLQHEETGGLIKIKEKSGARKDRYSSLSYNYWVACQLEAKLRKKRGAFDGGEDAFIFRAPKTKGGGVAFGRR